MKIMITGRSRRISDHICEHLEHETNFEFIRCWADKEAFTTLVQKEKPTVIIICLGYESTDSIVVYDYLGDYVKTRPVAIIVAANDQDTIVFSENTRLRKVSYIPTKPIPYNILYSKLETIEKKLKAIVQIDETIEDDFDDSYEPDTDITENEIGIPAPISSNTDKKKILIVEKNPDQIILIRQYLKDDFKVYITRSCPDAYDFLEENKVDLVLLDYSLTELEITLFLKRIRVPLKHMHLPIIILSDKNTKDNVIRVLNSFNPQAYLTKPIKKPELISKIKEILNEN